MQRINYTSTTSTPYVNWEIRDPSGASVHLLGGGAGGGTFELDPTGTDVGYTNPYLSSEASPEVDLDRLEQFHPFVGGGSLGVDWDKSETDARRQERLFY